MFNLKQIFNLFLYYIIYLIFFLFQNLQKKVFYFFNNFLNKLYQFKQNLINMAVQLNNLNIKQLRTNKKIQLMNFNFLNKNFLFINNNINKFSYYNTFFQKNIIILSLILHIITLKIWLQFNNSIFEYQILFSIPWLEYYKISLDFGIDGLSLFLVLLTTFLFPICLLSSFDSINYKKNFFFSLFFIMEICVLIVFTTLNLFIFYIFFESVLIPMFIIISIWGSRERKSRAAILFFMYTFIGSLFMLLGVILLINLTGTSNILLLEHVTPNISLNIQKFLWLSFFASFAVKMPIVPFHGWLTEAHVEAPTAGSIILAGILLKLGTYGYFRFCIGLFPMATKFFLPLTFTIGIIGVLFASFCAIRQTDMKRMIAYSSIAHMNVILMGMSSLTLNGLVGSIFQMISHGLVASALFFCVGVLYDRNHSRTIIDYVGVSQKMPIYASFFSLFLLANIALPGTCNFPGEVLLFTSIIHCNFIACFLSTLSMTLGAIYSLWLLNRILFTNLESNSKKLKNLTDVNLVEFSILFMFAILVLILGFYPNTIIEAAHPICIKYLIFYHFK